MIEEIPVKVSPKQRMELLMRCNGGGGSKPKPPPPPPPAPSRQQAAQVGEKRTTSKKRIGKAQTIIGGLLGGDINTDISRKTLLGG